MPSTTIKRVVVFGGGTGLSTILRGLKRYPIDLTAIVTVADDGGSSGRLFDQYDIPPPGDIRQVMAALSDVEPLIEKMFQYRFEGSDDLKGHSLGNLMLTALTNITGDFARAVEQMGLVLNIKGKVLPAANQRITLHAELEDGSIITGESKIPLYGRKIRNVFISPQDVKPLPETAETIKKADLIIFGPGSLYTSILPTILVQDIREAVLASQAKKVYIGNLTTQRGETFRYTASEHVQALYDHAGVPFLDAVLVNNADAFRRAYGIPADEEPWLVENDLDRLQMLVPEVFVQEIATVFNGVIMHKSADVADVLMRYIERT
ncbi:MULTISPECIES: gluconeogenesis factor YvcK family protein [unclassified Sporosarcina]|uniref:gluconeogenesis factor YvcK family protein n=1 Tax=unclassified Sporosarcina TaxID=2647733 RepID=UPI00203BDBDD|nr:MULTISPECIES: gluconeogenesis factor YvcK family protein [unclassified Sporosarcina]GKV65512.1 gluconeogenesis factor [Sporosarcina sp. NCCP-2331]GLB55637.1 gluconeogenesis factor [Sporosarcina sp. NCCP-2378]